MLLDHEFLNKALQTVLHTDAHTSWAADDTGRFREAEQSTRSVYCRISLAMDAFRFSWNTLELYHVALRT